MKIGIVEKGRGYWFVLVTEDRESFYYTEMNCRIRGSVRAKFSSQTQARFHLKVMIDEGKFDTGEVYTAYGDLRETIKKVDYKSLYEKYYKKYSTETRKLKDEVIEWEHIAKERQKMFNNLLASTEQMVKSCRELIEME